MAEHTQTHAGARTDVAEHQRTFEAFIRFWAYLFGTAAAILIFLALVNA